MSGKSFVKIVVTRVVTGIFEYYEKKKKNTAYNSWEQLSKEKNLVFMDEVEKNVVSMHKIIGQEWKWKWHFVWIQLEDLD